MIEAQNVEREAHRSLNRILPRVQEILRSDIEKDRQGWMQFSSRLHRNFSALFTLYAEVYSDRYDFFFHLEDLIVSVARLWFCRPLDLRELDMEREADPLWFESNQMLGAVCYVDLFAENLEGIRSRIPYFKELGITYLHLMPLFKAPEGESDGGYAVSSYRELNPALGSMEQLNSIASDFRKAGISLVLDLIIHPTNISGRNAQKPAIKNIWTSTASFLAASCPTSMSGISGKSFPTSARVLLPSSRHWSTGEVAGSGQPFIPTNGT